MDVPSFGPLTAKICIIGEAPGKEEEIRGIPFVGASGRLLDEMLMRNGINRAEVRVMNLINIRPPRNDFGFFYLDKKRTTPKPILAASIERLKTELKRIKPNVILVLGNEPLKALTGRIGITKWRGSILEWEGIKVVGTFHPASILRQYTNRTISELDIARVREESLSPQVDIPEREFITRPSYIQVTETLSKLLTVSKEIRLAFDIETIERRVRCLALSWDIHEAICIPFISLSHFGVSIEENRIRLPLLEGGCGNYWTPEEEYEILKLLDKVFRHDRIKLVAQNFPFDGTLLAAEFGFTFRNLHLDTLAGHHVLFPELPKSLDFLCSVYTKQPRYSDHNPGDDASEWEYNCFDACIDLEVSFAIEEGLREAGLWRFYKDHVEKTMLALTRAQNARIHIDVPRRDEIRVSEEKKLSDNLALLQKQTGLEINPNSPTQVKEYILSKGVRLPLHHKTKKPTTEEKALLKLMGKYPEKLKELQVILDCRESSKLISSFLTSELDSEGLLETSYNVSGTVNGRISSAQTIWNTGGNIHQIPKTDFRRLVIPREGSVFIKTDLKQAEALVVIWRARVMRLVDRVLNDPSFDIHTWNAAENVYHVKESEVTEEQRFDAKCGVHGGNYGLGAKTASLVYKVPFVNAKLAIEAYRKAIPEIAEWWDEVTKLVTKTRMLTTVLGRRRVFLGRLDHATFRSAFAFEPQGTVADVVNHVFHVTDVELPLVSPKCFPLLQVHDEIVFEIEKGKEDECLEVIKRAYHVPLKFEGVDEPLIIPVEIMTGPNWWDLEEIKND